MRRSLLPLVASIPFLLHCASASPPAAPANEEASPGTSVAELVSMTGEVVSVDQATRHVTLRGPLGGEVTGRVGEDVKNLAQVEPGDLVTIAYYQSVALSAAAEGEATPLVTGAAGSAAPGDRPSAYSTTETKTRLTVFSVDAAKGSVVFQEPDGTLLPVEVERPELVKKLEGLRAGDKVDVVVTEAVITGVTPATPGQKPSLSYEAATLVVDRGEVVDKVNNTLFIRNDRGRIIKVTVDPAFKFMLNGTEATVEDVRPGTRLHRTAFRVVESASYEPE